MACRLGTLLFASISCSTCRIAVSTWSATSAGTSSLAMVTKLTSLGSSLAARSTLRLSRSAKPPGCWMPMRLPLRSAMSLTLSRTIIEASNLFEFATMTLTGAAIGDADDGHRARRHADVEIARQHGAENLDAVFELHGFDIDAVFLVEPKLPGHDHRHVHDVRRRRRQADRKLVGLRMGRPRQRQRGSGEYGQCRIEFTHVILPDFFKPPEAPTPPDGFAGLPARCAILPDCPNKNNEGGRPSPAARCRPLTAPSDDG